MPAIDMSKVFHVPGRLCYGPTDLSLAFPHGGTSLAETREVIFNPNIVYHEVKAEEYGNEVIEIVYGGEAPTVTFFIRAWNDSAIQTLFPHVFTSANSDKVIEMPGSDFLPGSRASDKAVKLLFSPNIVASHPFLLLYKAIPMVAPTAALNMRLGTEFDAAVIFSGIRNASGKIGQIGAKQSLTL